MKAKRNQANVLAKECMVSALMQLLETKPLSAVSVTELTEKAGVSRMTYYRNYQSKEEIFQDYLDDIVDSYRSDVASWPSRGNYNDYRNLLHCFRYFKKYKEFIRGLIDSGMGDMVLKALTNYIDETYYQEELGQKFYYSLQSFSGALYNIYRAWIERNTMEEPEEMALVLCGMFQNQTADSTGV